jgi:hypothetical protein
VGAGRCIFDERDDGVAQVGQELVVDFRNKLVGECACVRERYSIGGCEDPDGLFVAYAE